MRVLMLVVVGIGDVGRTPHPRCTTNRMLVLEPPLWCRRPHEGFVIKARRQHRRHCIGDCAGIKAHGRPAVLAARDDALVQLLHRRARVGLGARASRELHQRAGLFGAGAVNTARAVVLEAARHQMNAVGEQRRRQGVAGITFVARAVVGERERTRTVDRASLRQAPRLRHGSAGSG